MREIMFYFNSLLLLSKPHSGSEWELELRGAAMSWDPIIEKKWEKAS